MSSQASVEHAGIAQIGVKAFVLCVFYFQCYHIKVVAWLRPARFCCCCWGWSRLLFYWGSCSYGQTWEILPCLLIYCLVCSTVHSLWKAKKKLKTSLVWWYDLSYSLPHFRFFETTPLGSILNRFSADCNTIDQVLNKYIWALMTPYFSQYEKLHSLI